MFRSPCLVRAVALILVSLAVGCSAPSAAAKRKSASAAEPRDAAPELVAYGQRDDVMRFGAELAARHNLDLPWVLAALEQARYVPRVARLMTPAPAGTAKNWAAYRERFVEPRRIHAGAEFWNDNRKWLALAEARYGVPPEIVIGIIGVETIYGRNMGSFRVLDALATLSFDFPVVRKDRSPFFRDELESFLVLCHNQGLEPTQPLGSYAGAMGMPQFMPSNVNKYAVDLDGDGHIDLHDNPADVIGSVAHYLAAFGWQRGLPTRFEVAAPVDAHERALMLVPDILPTFTVPEFAAHGAQLGAAALAFNVRRAASASAAPATAPDASVEQTATVRDQGPMKLALVELQNGDAAPSYVAGTANFYAITRYNWSSYYAMAVIDLGEAVAREVAESDDANTR
jgi:membrane-bound lytic murein transglycosylase B